MNTSSVKLLFKIAFVALLALLTALPTKAAAPTISSLSPTSGAVGTLVTISGSNFGSSQGGSSVTFNGVTASVTTWGSSSIKATVPSTATTGNVVVTVGGVASNGKSFTVVPYISSLTPNAAAVGASVTIAGTTFGPTQGSSTVKFNGTSAAVTNWSATSVSVTVPSGATTGNVVVTVSSHASNGVSFTVLATPSISSLSANSGAVGAAVTITGANFGSSQGNGTVKFNGTSATVSTWNATTIGVTVPSGATTGNVVVNASGVNTNGIAFTVLATPSISSLSANSGAVGAAVTITGANFGSSQGNGTVKFNGTSATVSTWNATTIGVTVPSGATTGNVVVNASGVNTNGIAFTVLPTPSITGLSITSGAIGAAVTVTGANLGSSQGNGTVKFNGTSATVSTWNATTIGVTVPPGATTGNVVVNASGVNTNAIAFTVLPTPSITGLSVTSGLVGTSVTISGTNLGSTQGGGSVMFNGTNAPVTSWGSSSITVIVPSGATTGNVVANASGVMTNGIGFTVLATPNITGIAPASGPVGESVTIQGTGFGSAQGSGTVSMNGTAVAVTSWSDIAIVVIVPPGASSGPFAVTAEGQTVYSSSFTVTSLPSGWTDTDIGSVGVAGSATYGDAVFTVKGAGLGLSSSSDGFNFAYQSLSGDGSIIARVLSIQGNQYSTSAGVMIRETLNPGSTFAYSGLVPYSQSGCYSYRLSTGGSASQNCQTAGATPYWVMLTRSGNTFTSFVAPDGVNWVQVGAQTISMAQAVYIGLGVTNYSTSSLATATYDNVSINSASTPAPAITSVSATTGPIGSQVTIFGTGFGAVQNGSLVLLNDAAVDINSWTNTSISITIPAGATSGDLVVSVAPTMNDSNPVFFTVTAQPLPTSWLDQDIGPVGTSGSATFANAVFTVKGAGQGFGGSSDGFHFVYQSLSGDGSILARVLSIQGNQYSTGAGVMIRETLNATSKFAYTELVPYSVSGCFWYRLTTSGSASDTCQSAGATPFWVMLVRSGSTFTSFVSTNGLNWVQVATETITMAETVYVGLAVTNATTASVATATFDSLSVSSNPNPAPVITSLSATTGSVGSSVLITGLGFGTVQGGSQVTLNDTPMTINLWTDTSITITIPSGATSGDLEVLVAPGMNSSNPVLFSVTSLPLPEGWLDADVGNNPTPGSATYSGGVFGMKSSGSGITGTADGLHFVYQPVTGNAVVIARVSGMTGGDSSQAQIGVMIRETLNPGASNALAYFYPFSATAGFSVRTATGANTTVQTQSFGNPSYPYWVELARTGNTFQAYVSQDGFNWVQVGTTQTISMAQTVYVGLAATSPPWSNLLTTTFDNVSVSTTSSPAPVITSLSTNTAPIGGQVVITGNNFGASQGGSIVTLSNSAMSVSAWTNTYIIITIAAGATSGPLLVSVAPSMNDSNAVQFEVTSNPLPIPWLDVDIGTVGVAGSATYVNGVFTVNGAGAGTFGTADGINFVYQPMTGDGMITAQVTSVQGNGSPEAGVMIRETLNSTAQSMFAFTGSMMTWRSTTTSGYEYGSSGAYIQLVRVGSSFSAYSSPDGVNWTQIGQTQTINMAQTVYVGLAVTNRSTSALATATFNSPILAIGSTPFVTALSPTTGGAGNAVTIAGSNFGSSQGTSSVQFNGATASSITSWSNSQIVALVPSAAPVGPGPVSVTVGGVTSPVNPTFTVIKPTISSLAPPAAPPYGTVVINGSGFGPDEGGGQVFFNGLSGSGGILSWSNTQITVSVPLQATSGPVTVSKYGIASNGVSFTLLEALSVTNISPTIGAPGSTVTITGTGFGPSQSNSAVDFFGASPVPAAIQSWSDTQIVATVPSGAASGPITVTTAGTTWFGPTFTMTTITQITDSKNNQSSYTSALIGGAWVPLSVQGSGCSTCNQRGNISYTYDSSGRALSRTDENGNTTTYTYDSNGSVLTITAPVGPGHTATTTYTYNNFGQVLTVIDPMGFETTNTYDANGNLLSITTPAPGNGASASVTRFAYNSLGELTTITDPRGNSTSLSYTPAGLIQTITDAQSNVTTYGYDSQGNRTSVTDANNKQTTFTYDAMSRLTKITYPDTTTIQFGYDYRGRRISMTDQNTKTTTFGYDDADRLTTVTDAATNVTTYGYDTESNLTSIQDANHNTTYFAYDAFGRVTQTTFPSGYIETYGYDNVGNLTSKTDRKNQLITYTYDQLNRLVLKSYPDTSTVNYTYDNDSRLTQVTDPTGTYQFTFDNMGRLTGTSAQYAFLTSRTFTAAYNYDAASNRVGFTDPESGSTSYVYDTLNRLQTLTPPTAISGGSFGFGYDALSRRTSLTRPNAVNTSYSYDNLSRLLSVTHAKGGATLDGASYTLDNAGNRTAKNDLFANVSTNYGYDNIYELLSAAQSGTTTESYTFDAVGNRLTSIAGSWTNNTSNELTTSPTASYTYDANGNTQTSVASAGTTTYNWDYENRLTSVVLPGSAGTVRFEYDPFGRRIYKSSSSGTSIYAYDGDNLVEETNAAGGVVARYSQGLNIDEPLAMLRSAATSYYQADGLGSTTSLTDTTGAVANSYTYDSFGNLLASSGSLVNSFRYTGREFDPETSLYYYRARYYDQGSGRFLSEDPIRFKGGLDFYSYASNNPVRSKDPYGLWTINLGGTGSFGWGPIHFQGGGGIVIGSDGSLGTYIIKGVGGAASTGLSGSFGLTGGISSACSISGFGGPFLETGESAGLGPGESVSFYAGNDSSNGNRMVTGGSVTAGVAVGGDIYSDVTKTTVTTIIPGNSSACGCK
jgi:RHS repeat-associated protein